MLLSWQTVTEKPPPPPPPPPPSPPPRSLWVSDAVRGAHPNIPTRSSLPTEAGHSAAATVPGVAVALLAALGALYWCARRARASRSKRGGEEDSGVEGHWLRGATWCLGDARWSRVAAVDDADDEDRHCGVGATPSLTRLGEDEKGACQDAADEDGIEVL